MAVKLSRAYKTRYDNAVKALESHGWEKKRAEKLIGQHLTSMKHMNRAKPKHPSRSKNVKKLLERYPKLFTAKKKKR